MEIPVKIDKAKKKLENKIKFIIVASIYKHNSDESKVNFSFAVSNFLWQKLLNFLLFYSKSSISHSYFK